MSFYHSGYGISRKKKKPFLRYIIWISIVVAVFAIIGSYLLYQVIFKPNVWTPDGKNISIYIPTNANFDNVKQLLALYFARIQVKSCWNTSPMTDIELSDIADVALPTAKKSITLLIQKPRKGYDIDTYSLDGRTVNSVMRDIVYVKDTLTHGYRHLGDQHTQNYLFIFSDASLCPGVNSARL